MNLDERSNRYGPDTEGDLGLGSRITQQSRQRFLNRDGSFNAVRTGLPFFRSLSIYHALLSISWPRFEWLLIIGYFATNVVFAVLYLLCGPTALSGMKGETFFERFPDAFFFSVQTLATIGYGKITPNSLAANMIVSVEALVGLLGFALATGLLFSRFSRPDAKIIFSDVAVIAPYRGIEAFEFRIANGRRNQLLEVNATVSLSRWEENNGTRIRRFYELPLERRRVTFLPLHWVIVHPIDESSPLRGESRETLQACDAEFLILLTAVDDTFSQTVYARSSYKWNEVFWGAKFTDMFVPADDGAIAVDLRRLHQTERVERSEDRRST